MATIFLTGGNGFIGKNVIEHYTDIYHIEAPTRSQLDLTNSNQVEEYFCNKEYDFIIHSASVGVLRKFQADPATLVHENLRSFVNTFKQRTKSKRFIFLSSGAAYGRPLCIRKIDESYFEQAIPQDSYGLSKFICSRMVAAELPQKAVSLHLFGVFGAYEDCQVRFISNAIVRSLFNLPIIIKNQNAEFDYLYIKDFIKILTTFLTSPASYSHYNIASGEPVSLLELAEIIRSILGTRQQIIVNDTKITTSYTANNQRLLNFLGSEFTFTPIKQAIEELIVWYEARLSSLNKDLILNPI